MKNQTLQEQCLLELLRLDEATRTQLVAQSRNVGKYKDTSRGRNRMERKKFSKIANSVKSYNEINMNDLFKKDLLLVNIPVVGETDEYTVSIRLDGVVAEIQKNIKNNGNKFEYKTVIQSLTKVFNTSDVYTKCTCDDYCLHPDTKIKLLDGTTATVAELEKKVKASSSPIYVYSVDENGDFKPGRIKDVWISGYVEEMIKITLDNGKSVVTTPEHPYMLRNGQYKEAKDLEVGTSLMPLYFGTTKNGYETVKSNSKVTTEFHSTYKQVANALLQKEIEVAKERSGEESIVIHHKDFNKSNNNPENLLPMGMQEHYRYHYEHVFESGAFDKFKAAGEEYRKLVMDRDTQEYQKQAAIMSTAIQNYWANLTEEERLVDSKRKSTITKSAWRNGCFDTAKRKAADEARKAFLHTPEIEKKSAEGIRKYWANLSDKERENVILQRKQNLNKGAGWNEGKHLSDKDRFNKSQAALNRPQELKDLQAKKIRETKMLKVFNRMLEDSIDLTAENYEKYRSSYFSKSPKLSVLFNNIEEAIEYFKLNHKIIKIETISYDFLQPVYDIEIEDYHNFYIDAGVILHNCYRFKHWNIVKNVSVDDSSQDPGPGKGIANPNDDKGRGCKHILLCLSNGAWMMKVASTICNYCHYLSEKKPEAFLKLIFPKLYGVPADEAADNKLVADNDDLESGKDLIDVINDWAKNRGKIQKGSNINPVYADKLAKEQKDKNKSVNQKPDEQDNNDTEEQTTD